MKIANDILEEQFKRVNPEKDFYIMKTEQPEQYDAMIMAMNKFADQKAIEFAKWIADYISEDEHGGEHSDNFQLIDGNYYWKDDEDGNQPLTEEQLYKMFLEENKKQLNHV